MAIFFFISPADVAMAHRRCVIRKANFWSAIMMFVWARSVARLFYMAAAQFDCWRHTQLIIDAITGQGGMFSLENGSGLRFLPRSRLFSEAENAELSQSSLTPHHPEFCSAEHIATEAS